MYDYAQRLALLSNTDMIARCFIEQRCMEVDGAGDL